MQGMLLLDYKSLVPQSILKAIWVPGGFFEVILGSATLKRLKNTGLEDGHEWDTRGRTDRTRSDVIEGIHIYGIFWGDRLCKVSLGN